MSGILVGKPSQHIVWKEAIVSKLDCEARDLHFLSSGRSFSLDGISGDFSEPAVNLSERSFQITLLPPALIRATLEDVLARVVPLEPLHTFEHTLRDFSTQFA